MWGVLRGFVRLFGKVEIWERNCFDGMREDLPSNCVGVRESRRGYFLRFVV